MIIKKIVPGFVVQTFTTESQYPTHQEFVAGNDITYEDVNGNALDEKDIEWEFGEPTLPMKMEQPNPRGIDSTED